MSRRSIIAHHLIWPLYGHWAPNDPRGSGSGELYNEKFEPLGPIHFGRKPEELQPSREELREFHRRFKALLKFPVFWLDAVKRQACGEAIGDVVRRMGYTCYACAVCANHAHAVIRIHRPRNDALAMWNQIADESRLRLRAFADVGDDHPVWAERPYKVFLYAPEEVRGRIRYVEMNPVKEGLARQTWDFVAAYDNWPLHKQARGVPVR